MPPRPASSSARRGSSQSQGSEVERALKLLERLAAAAELEAFVVDEQQEERCLSAMQTDLPLLLALPVSAGPPGVVPAVVAALLPAVARGMQLVAQQLDLTRLQQHVLAARSMCKLVGTMSDCFKALTEGSPADIDRAPMRLALSVLAVRAGVPKAHEQLSLRLTSIISDPAAAISGATAAAQPQEMAPVLARLVATQLNVLDTMACAWPGGGAALFGPSLFQAVLAAASLAVAALSNREAPVSNSSGQAIFTTWLPALNFAAVLADAYRGSGRSVPAQITGSGSVGMLLLMFLGLAAEQLHQQQCGLSPAAVGAAPSAAAAAGASAAQQQQQLAVPAHHTQLLQALGVAAGGLHPDGPTAAAPAVWRKVVVYVLCGTTEQQQLLAEAAAAASCQLPLLLVLLECSLLHPTEQLVQAVTTMLLRVLERTDVPTGCELAPPLLRAILEQDACMRTLEAATAAAAPATGAPAAAAPAAAAVGDPAAGALNLRGVLMLLALEANLAAVACAASIAGTDEAAFHRLLAGVSAVWLEHTAQVDTLLEAGLRTLLPVGLVQRAAAAARAARASAHARLSAGNTSMAADSQQQVFALLLSCLKAATAEQGSSSDEGGAALDDATRIVMAAAEVRAAASAWLFPPSSSSRDTSSSDGNQASVVAPAAAADAAAGLGTQLGCVLLARCLVAAGRLLQQQAQAPASSSPSSPHLQLQALLLCGAERAATLPGQQLAQQAADEPWPQQLLDEHAQLKQQLESLAAQMAASGEASPQLPAAAMAATAEQLQVIGAAVCAALPVQQCCNHHDCSNREQMSELELVSGKSCVCGGCRVARYCSRECQVAHFKGWHKAVCKRLQTQLQQQQQQAMAQQAAAQPQNECRCASSTRSNRRRARSSKSKRSSSIRRLSEVWTEVNKSSCIHLHVQFLCSTREWNGELLVCSGCRSELVLLDEG